MKPLPATLLLALALAGCGEDALPAATETVAETDLVLSVRGEGELRSAKPTPLTVPGRNWSSRRVEWMLDEGTAVEEGDVLARFGAPDSEQQLAQALIDLQRNALTRATKEGELDTAIGRVDVDLSQVAVQLGIARRYADADLSAIARNQVLDAIEDARFLETRQDVLEWQRDQSDTRGGAELAVLDAQRDTHQVTAQARQDDLDALELRAPNDGVLLLTANWSGDKPAVGANLFAGTDFGSLPDTSTMEVEIVLPQIEAQGVQVGMAVELHPVGHPEQTITSELSWVASAATTRSRQDPVRYLAMRAPVPAERIAQFGLVPGQQFAARVFMLREPALSVANVAVQQRGGRSLVQVRDGRGFEEREIELGVRGTARSQVLSGLDAGDVVLLSPGGDPAELLTPTEADGDAGQSTAATAEQAP
ncbi:MAG: efflux RND transporter periplasmic adaptor subunit [Luteimonas sp.]